MQPKNSVLPEGYSEFLASLKRRVQKARLKATLSVNRELILLYWEIGQMILKRQRKEGWGAKVIDRLAHDLRKEFPDMKGFSARNLKYMRSFAEAYPDKKFVQQAAAQIPWFHHCILLDKVKDHAERLWYIQQTTLHGWSRNVLVHQIESGLYHRKGKAITNFDKTLPSPQSDLAQETLKDPYMFDFLGLTDDIRERELEKELIARLRDFLLELGSGFAFVGSQVHLEVGGEDFYLDLLFYHLKLRSYVIIDLKTGSFKPEYAGKMNFYLATVDDLLRHPDDNPSIGIILCKSKNKVIVEYALKDTSRPIGVSAYRLTRTLPEELKTTLPSVEELEKELIEKKEPSVSG